MTLLLLAVIMFVVVCLAGFATWVGQHLQHGPYNGQLSERDVEQLTRPRGNISVVERGKRS